MAEPSIIQITTSDAELPDLPGELWREIFARLPAKTLIRFRSVCKTLCSVIDSSDFILMHLQIYNNNRNQCYLLASEWCKRHRMHIHSRDTCRKIDQLFGIPENWDVLGSCYGLILIKYLWFSNRIVFYNPCIRKSLLIPPCPFVSMGYKFINYWPGFAPSSNDYKVFAFGYVKYPEFSIAVYSLNDHLWRIKDRLDVHIPGFLSFYGEVGDVLYFKGSMYCLGFDKYKPGVACDLRTHLVSFDYDLEEFDFVDLPDAAEQNTINFNFVLGESVAFFSMSSKRTCIWVLVKDNGKYSWRLWNSGYADLNALQFLESVTHTKIFNMEKNTFFLQSAGRLYSYNFRSHQIQHLKDYIGGPTFFETYVECLVLHKKNPREDFGILPVKLLNIEEDWLNLDNCK